ncbi:hypothetical protein ABZ705_08480 [Streptomyces sp. NPDC006984]|uniref:hypothetical protein n=1 Tax=Streptomyces sp. NPDC006984 TaxID=3155463 RepID=UPI003402EFBE
MHGWPLATRTGDVLDAPPCPAEADRTTAAGRCAPRLPQLAYGRLRLDESGVWESHEGRATGAAQEPAPGRSVGGGLRAGCCP